MTYKLELTDTKRNINNGLVVSIEPIDRDVVGGASGKIILPPMPLDTSGMLVGKTYYLVSEDEYTPPEAPQP
jgi:hypothetical protein